MENKNKLEGSIEEIGAQQVGDIKRKPIEEILGNSVSVYNALQCDEGLRERANEICRRIVGSIAARLKELPHNVAGLISVDSRVLYPPRLEITLNEGYWLGTFGNWVQKVSKFGDLEDDFEREYSKPLGHLTGQYRGFVPLEFRDEPPITDVIQIDHRQESLREVGLVIVPLSAIKSYKIIEKWQRK